MFEQSYATTRSAPQTHNPDEATVLQLQKKLVTDGTTLTRKRNAGTPRTGRPTTPGGFSLLRLRWANHHKLKKSGKTKRKTGSPTRWDKYVLSPIKKPKPRKTY